MDLKAFRDRTYRELGGVLQNTLDTIRFLKKLDFWLEIVTLIVPGLNDSDDELKEIADFLAGVSPDIPWHVTAFHPDYKMTDPPRTSAETLNRAHRIGRQAGLRYVYSGNLPGLVGDRESTFCVACGELLIRRSGFEVHENSMDGSTCPSCGMPVPGVWSPDPLRRSRGPGLPRRVRP